MISDDILSLSSGAVRLGVSIGETCFAEYNLLFKDTN